MRLEVRLLFSTIFKVFSYFEPKTVQNVKQGVLRRSTLEWLKKQTPGPGRVLALELDLFFRPNTEYI